MLTATGRECKSSNKGDPWDAVPKCTNVNETQSYSDAYCYDYFGKILEIIHNTSNYSFKKKFTGNNKLKSLHVDERTLNYKYDENGNVTLESESRHFVWDHRDRLNAFYVRDTDRKSSLIAYYLYDSSGIRVKKKIQRLHSQHTEITVNIDVIFEHHILSAAENTKEYNLIHVMDNEKRIAIIRIGNLFSDKDIPSTQYQHGDHLGSVNLITSNTGSVMGRPRLVDFLTVHMDSRVKKDRL